MRSADFSLDERAEGLILSLSGDWSALGLGRAGRRLSRDLAGRDLAGFDVAELGRFDTAGALAIVLATRCRLPPRGWESRPEGRRILEMVETLERRETTPPARPGSFNRALYKIGHGVMEASAEGMRSLGFLGQLIVSTARTLARPSSLRWPSLVNLMERAGLDAMPIVIITNVFIGAVIAFLGADLLQLFGASVFAVELIGIAVLREFAVVITAVLLAGRSASAFAAEIGSMKMNQEIDAMRVMGVDPFQALVIPRMLALLVMLPLLTFVAMLAGLFGGLLVTWTNLDLGPAFFITRIQMNVGADHLWVGLSKAPVFAMVIAAIGCRQGMAVAGDVESLGRRVTSAVVQAIFAIIALDAAFALIFLEMGI